MKYKVYIIVAIIIIFVLVLIPNSKFKLIKNIIQKTHKLVKQIIFIIIVNILILKILLEIV